MKPWPTSWRRPEASRLPAVALAVLAPGPAAGAALAFLEPFPGAADAPHPRLLFFRVLDPADELVAGERRDVVPGGEGGGAGDEGLAEVRREGVDRSAGDGLAHRVRVAARTWGRG